MNFSQRQADPRRHMTGFAVVILFHVILGYLLVTGLAKKIVDVVRAPVETKVIEEVKPPPPPEIVVPPPPKMDAPPPPFIPPPEVFVANPPPAPVITSTPVAPPAPVNIAPPPAPAPPAPPAPARPAVVSIGVACATQVAPQMPAKASREGIAGSVRARLTIKNGKVVGVEILSSRPRGVFDSAVRNAVAQYGCQTGDETITAEQDFVFKVE